MAGTAILARPTGRGRQSGDVEQLRDLREELTAERLEGSTFAARVVYVASLIRNGAVIAGDMGIADLGGELEALGQRHLRQRSSGVL